MIRWLVVVTVVGLAVAGTVGWRSLANAESSAEAALWDAAGVVRLPSSIQAPPLRLKDLSGELVDVRQFRGRLVMLYFWATW